MLAVCAATLVGPGPAAAQLKAGVGSADATWHVGASAGQYASDGTAVDPANGNYDPTAHSTRRAPSYGVQSRLSARAIVVEGPDGKRFAVVKNDQYIPQDLLWRRTAQLLAAKPELGINQSNLTMAVTHNHSSPMYSSTAWGVWAFQDVFDIRFYNYLAERTAAAVEEAARNLKPVRVGASVGTFDKTPRHSFGPQLANDGTPAGYPQSDTDHDLTVVRFDDVSDPGNPKPLANLVNFSLHPEFLDGNDLISADYVGPLEAMTDRSTGALTIWTQGAVGTAEPERSSYHSIHERLEFTHREYRQAEYGARLMSNAVEKVWRDVAQGTPERPESFIPFRTNFNAGEVAFFDRWFPGPITHPYPGVSNCKTDSAFAGNPQIPVVGLPDCQGVVQGLGSLADLIGLPDPPVEQPGIDPALTTEDFERAGIPIPANYSAPSYTGLQEDINVHLQAFRIGDILFTVCSCEQWADQSRNIRTRTDRVAGNEHLGYRWKDQCRPNGDGSYGNGPEGYGTGTWTCLDPRNTSKALDPLSDQLVERMHRQVVNPANGWNDPAYAAQADSEPANLREIKGNYTHDDDAASAARGYRLTIPMGMGNDYNGYIATYREYQRGDHYRKALTGWGPHSSDYMATRLVNLGRVLNGGNRDALLPPELGDGKIPADLALNEARARSLGDSGSAAIAAYEARLPNDGGPVEAVRQPPDIERFDGTFFTWIGGSNYTDDPRVTVQRRRGGDWERYAGQAGEIPVTLAFPQGPDAPSYESGSFKWRWTAHFEAFAAPFETVEGRRATPPGTYRFVVRGQRRAGGRPVAYGIESKPFTVEPWGGISVEDVKLEEARTISFRTGPRHERKLDKLTAQIGPIDYPDSYDYEGAGVLPRFIEKNFRATRDPAAPNDASKLEWYCDECSFRPWIDFGEADLATVTYVHPDGSSTRVPATRRDDGRWHTSRPLGKADGALVGPGCVQDEYGNFNRDGSRGVGGATSGVDARCRVEGLAGEAGGLPCPRASGRVRGKRLGRARLGFRRARHRRLLAGLTKPRKYVDRFCHADGSTTRIGYPSPRLNRILSRRKRRKLKGRAVLILTASRHYALRGVSNGTKLKQLRRRYPRLRRFKVGANTWYLARRGRRGARKIFKVRHRRVGEIGVGSAKLTRRRRQARVFLRSFS